MNTNTTIAQAPVADQEAPASSIVPVSVFTFVHVTPARMRMGAASALEYGGIYPPNREK